MDEQENRETYLETAEWLMVVGRMVHPALDHLAQVRRVSRHQIGRLGRLLGCNWRLPLPHGAAAGDCANRLNVGNVQASRFGEELEPVPRIGEMGRCELQHKSAAATTNQPKRNKRDDVRASLLH